MPSAGGALSLTSGLNCVVFEAPTYIRMVPPGPLTGTLVTMEAQEPFLINVPLSESRLMAASSLANSKVWAYAVAGGPDELEWVPMAAPEYVTAYSATTTRQTFDLGVTGITEIYISPAALVWVVFGAVGEDLSAARVLPIYPSAPMRFKLGPSSRVMALLADTGTTSVTVTFVGRAR